MRRTAYFCDLCARDGEVRLAYGLYEGEGRALWAACEEHLRVAERWGLLVKKLFELPGDLDPKDFEG